jgi:glycosyltransferase involved in cell wall biosynthesis
MKQSAGNRVLMLLENVTYPTDDRVRREAKTLVSAGYQVSVISPKWSGQLWKELVDGVQVFRFPPPPPASGFVGYLWEYGYSMVVIFALSLLVWTREGFDILHAHHPPDTFVFIAAFYKLFGKRYVLDHHDLAPELYHARFRDSGRSAVFRVLVGLEKLACHLADHVIATNQSYKAMEMQRGGVPEARITIVRNGPDLNELRVADTPRQSRQERGAEHPATDLPASGLEHDARQSASKTILGYVGVIGFQDGVDHLLRALRHLVDDFGRTDFRCILVGHGDAVPSLKSLTQQLALDEYVSFAGWVNKQSEVARYLSMMDICLAPEPSDPFNDRSTAAKVMEYMALGKPVVAFDLPEHRFSAQDAAVYARPNDELDFARQIALLMDDPVRGDEMGRLGRQRIETELAWSQQSKNLLQAYEILQRGVR